MKYLLMSAALTTLCATGPVLAEADMISETAVSFDLPAVTNKAAALRFTDVADDLKNAITALLVGRLAEDGKKIGIDISEVELSNSYTEAVGTSDTRLVGIVSITDDSDNSNFDSYTLSVDINQASTFFPAAVDMTKLKSSADEYYTAMIQAFASHVVTALDE